MQIQRVEPSRATRIAQAAQPHQWTHIDGTEEKVCQYCLQTRTGAPHAIKCRQDQSTKAFTAVIQKAEDTQHHLILINDVQDQQVLYCGKCGAIARVQPRKLLKDCSEVEHPSMIQTNKQKQKRHSVQASRRPSSSMPL